MADYIEREAVINDIGELFTLCRETLPNENGHHYIVEKELATHLDFVLNIPAADVRPVVRGEWLRKPDPYEFFDTIPVCSNCGCTTKWREEYPHCPNCGADMREES